MLQKNNCLKVALIAVPSLVAVLSLAFAGSLYHRVRAFDAKHKCDVLAGLSATELAERQRKRTPPKSNDEIRLIPGVTHRVASGEDLTSISIRYGVSAASIRDMNGMSPDEGVHVGQIIRVAEDAKDSSRTVPRKGRIVKAGATEAATNAAANVTLAVDRVEYDHDTRISIFFNERPDMDVVRNYIKVEPLNEGIVGFRYSTDYSCSKRKYEPVIYVTGDYAYRTNVTLKVLKGFPLYGKGANPMAEGSMTNDFSYVFQRKDPAPSVSFADHGRYLPPGGRKAIRVETISVTNLATEIARVEPRNVVQLLAREEGAYRRWGMKADADGESTLDLSGACETGLVRCVNRPCEKETHLFPIAMNDGGRERGVFLVAIRNGDHPHEESYWSDFYNPNHYRLVCLSDLGLSVRHTKDGLGVWVTSLTSGRPVNDAHVEVYSSANILLAEGDSDANGWCEPKCQAKGEPFAVVVWTPSDMTFIALSDSMEVGETYADGARPDYLDAAEVDAFVWTERGIYRHGERIFTHVIVRDGTHKAPKPLPITLVLKNPKGNVYATKTLVTDGEGTFAYDGFAVADEQPSGKWTIQACLPGKDGKVLAEREIKIEEFAPPQIRVNVTAEEGQNPTNFTFRIAAEHLFGGPARALSCEGAVVFEDVPFAPQQWKGFTFGNDQLGLKPCFRRLSQRVLDDSGMCEYSAPLWADSGRPRAAVRATGQGVVFEDGGRPATARKSIVCHYYPYYIGCNLPSWLKCPETGLARIDFVCVNPDGSLRAGERKLVGRIDRIDSVYSYRRNSRGESTWDCERTRTTVLDKIAIAVNAEGRAEYALPMKECGDYVLTATDPETGASFGRAFYLSEWGDDVVRAPLSNPTEVTIRTDKSVYRVGERPRLLVKAPFAGYAMMSVLRDGLVYSEVINLTNATSEVVLRPVGRDWAPNVDVALSVIQSANASARHLAMRAHGLATVRVRPVETELKVKLDAAVAISDGSETAGRGSRVTVNVEAPGATAAVVTLVDEGINLLTGERTPDPVDWLSRARTFEHPLCDLYGCVLPVVDDGLKASGIKTGGGFGAEMLGRVSPVPTRRFKPLALWQEKVALTDGKAQVAFDLPEFVGEVRVTAVAYSAIATGAASVQRKVTPKLIMQPDAPRFVAPHDAFDATMTLRNCSGADGEVRYEFVGDEWRHQHRPQDRCLVQGMVFLRKGESTNLVFSGCEGSPADGKLMGPMSLRFSARGFGERHETRIELPVRPAVAWQGKADVVRLDPGETFRRTVQGDAHRFAVVVGASPMAECAAALEWLADYPHGCLEQTASRIFPLVTAGGVLNAVASRAATNRAEYVAAGVHRVESMIRENNFVMWPDCSCEPWDLEVSLYAAHFLIEAEKSGQKLNPLAKEQVLKLLRRWALRTGDDESAYACHTLALAGQPEKDRMFRLYDNRTKLSALSRARLARAFVAIRDPKRAEALMQYAQEPQSVKEAAFNVLALIDLNPDDARIPKLIDYLASHRDRQRYSWGTTGENAHALLAIGAYYSHHPVKDGEVRVGACGLEADDAGRDREIVRHVLGKRDSLVDDADGLTLTNMGPATAFVTIREQWLNDPRQETNEVSGLSITRRYLRTDGSPADLSDLVRGEMLITELTITSDVTRVVSDLVVEDLFAGAFEPVHRELGPESLPTANVHEQVQDWVMRKDARDDRMLVFSKKFVLGQGQEAKVFYPVRVVSAGDFVLPGPSVEAMYAPSLKGRCAPSRISVRK